MFKEDITPLGGRSTYLFYCACPGVDSRLYDRRDNSSGSLSCGVTLIADIDIGMPCLAMSSPAPAGLWLEGYSGEQQIPAAAAFRASAAIAMSLRWNADCVRVVLAGWINWKPTAMVGPHRPRVFGDRIWSLRTGRSLPYGIIAPSSFICIGR